MNVSKRKDRLAMAAAIAALADKHVGWTAEVEDLEAKPDAHPIFDNRRVRVTLKGPRGLSTWVDLDGTSAQRREGVFVVSWHGVENPYKLVAHFAGSVNPFHWHKATDVFYSFESLLEIMPQRMAAATSGEAFQ